MINKSTTIIIGILFLRTHPCFTSSSVVAILGLEPNKDETNTKRTTAVFTRKSYKHILFFANNNRLFSYIIIVFVLMNDKYSNKYIL